LEDKPLAQFESESPVYCQSKLKNVHEQRKDFPIQGLRNSQIPRTFVLHELYLDQIGLIFPWAEINSKQQLGRNATFFRLVLSIILQMDFLARIPFANGEEKVKISWQTFHLDLIAFLLHWNDYFGAKL
jgi:hypothetical protein